MVRDFKGKGATLASNCYSRFPLHEQRALIDADRRITERLLAFTERNLLTVWCPNESSKSTWVGNGSVSDVDFLAIVRVMKLASVDLWVLAAPPLCRSITIVGANVPNHGPGLAMLKRECQEPGAPVELRSQAFASCVGDLIAWAQRSVDIHYQEGTNATDAFVIIPDMRLDGATNQPL